jgi:lycopene beta-cyclase
MSSQATNWDVVIAGAGLAGLSLAAELAEPQFAHLRVLLMEPRAQYVRDRTWSYWDSPIGQSSALPERWQGLVQTKWPRWSVSLGGRQVISQGDVAYASVRADAFYEAALAAIAKAPHIQWRQRDALDRIEASDTGVALITQEGKTLHTQRLFDSRPPAPLAPDDWVQHFTGWEVQTSAPCFEPECVQLMDFERKPNGLHFIYCLPYSSTLALVESTWISRSVQQAGVDADAELKNALHTRWGCTQYDITFRERGALPLMPLMPDIADGQLSVVRIGRAGGMLRAATGYAFCATLRQTSDLAASLSAHLALGRALVDWQAPAYTPSAMDQWMDSVLFRVLEKDWQAAPGYFLSLFAQVPEKQLIAFLQGSATWKDRIAVMRALPPWPFMRSALG